MTLRKRIIWVVTADEAIARILQRQGARGELEPVEELTDPDAHARGTDLRHDAHGRRGTTVASSAGEGEQHVQAETFARKVAQRLTEAFHQHRFDELRIAAAPRFLGLLRKSLDTQVARMVTETVNKDLTHMTEREITEHMFGETAAR
jgi:protein required for attachment to host cells